jgi:hypothetical protein
VGEASPVAEAAVAVEAAGKTAVFYLEKNSKMNNYV